MQTLYLATNWDPIYWDTACLIVNSGAIDPENGGQTDYSKIAKAMGEIINAGIKIGLVNINRSQYGFEPDVENQQILYGMKAMLNVGDDIIEKIIANRPYSSIKDFYYRVNPKKQEMISLIKGGAFDSFMDRKLCMGWYLWETCDKKKRITLQNMGGLIKYNLLPAENEKQLNARRVYEFNRYLKAICVRGNKTEKYYLDNERAIPFLIELGYDSLIETDENNLFILQEKVWNKVYQEWMDIFRNWINENKEQILQALNESIFKEDWEKYALGSFSTWEMEALCFYYHDHELINVNKGKYGIRDFSTLPEEGVITGFSKRGYPIYELSKICGTCIAKNKTKSIVSLLTTNGVVNVKFRKEYFSLFDKQISVRGDDGKKHVVEKSWFNKGSMILVMGMRSGDDFISKKYQLSNGHQLYKIDSIDNDGNIVLRSTRAAGEQEEDTE